MCVSGYTSFLIYIQSTRVCVGGGGVAGGGGGCVFVYVYAFVRSGDSVSARVQCLSVCQFDFALYHCICVVICYYANDFYKNIYAFHALFN